MIFEKIAETAVFALAFECGFQLGSSEIIDVLPPNRIALACRRNSFSQERGQ